MFLDQAVLAYLYTVHTPLLDFGFRIFSTLGDPAMIIAVLLVAGVVFRIFHRKHLWGTLCFAVAVGTLFAVSLKDLVLRVRPIEYVFAEVNGYSFPSAHALVSTVCYGLVGYYVYRYAKDSYIKTLGFLIMTIVPFGVGFSRVYLGVHWFSDVLAGWCIGALLLSVFITHIRYEGKRI